VNRRKFLAMAVTAGGFIAGCTRSGVSGDPEESPTESPTMTPTVKVNEEGFADPLTEYRCPGRPEDGLTEETVTKYTTQFERAYKARQLVHGETNAVSVDYKDIQGMEEHATVAAVQNGFRVQFHVSIGYATRYDETDSVVHADTSYDVAYFLDNDSTYRVEWKDWKLTAETPPDPREEGSPVECSE